MSHTVLLVIAVALIVTGLASRPRVGAQVVLGAGVVGIVAAAVLLFLKRT